MSITQAGLMARWDDGLPVGPQLLKALRAAIIQSELKPGIRLSEQDVAQRFGLSRQPVREAFIRLADEGLLEIRPQRGTFVRRISQDAVMDGRFMREAIEADLVKVVAHQSDRALVADLRRLVMQQSATAEGDAVAFMPLDESFHRLIAEAAGRSRTWNVLQQIKAQMDRVRFLTTAEFPKGRLIAQHTAIVSAIEAGDVSAAEDAMRSHLRKVLVDLPAIMAAHPEYFEPPTRDTPR
ncbi:GntR family transcriptional regulator [Fulvimarina sp. 2208YS6-2-32]|uniref:GntR family transcriptional regulator n=1 Tax=Fulvimarina uroteuthidis TaxID=3098149 RepID=A0ABU5I5X8_9HYPH|nr:GntR family transcriptional regulator [Fulvimarina sp. 2208YS6-2-32]MDY8110313.1 GntR family transcriptional regulator [Fulvimarina sp. 2208YS6-2-32]